MFEISWGELVVLTGVGLTLIGRKDLPSAARMAGTQVGRLVGLLQGARARADRFAAHNELKQLQNELRSGLRELDAVKSELVVSMSGRGLMGRGLGATVSSVNKLRATATTSSMPTSLPPSIPSAMASSTAIAPGQMSQIEAAERSHARQQQQQQPSVFPPEQRRMSLPPRQTSIAAVAEDEWERQGISFRSRAEQGAGMPANYDVSTSGSALLANAIKESLIFDQYERVVQEQEDALQSKMDRIIQEKIMTKKEETKQT